MSGGRRAITVLLVTVGFLLIQCSWILAVPPFRAMDEFDHAYRAAAVAGGQWVASDEPVPDGRGQYVQVPRSLVEAAAPVCSWYDYTGPDNCRAAERSTGSDQVEVASAASDYNPLFYWVVGTPSSQVEGFDFLYSTRFVAALVNALALGMCALLLTGGGAGRWRLLALFVVATPTLVYSTSVGAPNGLEMTGGLLLWCSAATLAARSGRREESLALAGMAVGAVLLAVPRLLGPFWLALILVSTLALVPPGRWRELARARPWGSGAVVATTAAAAASGLAWSWWASTDLLDEPIEGGDFNPLVIALREVPLWILQAIAGFPLRNEPAPIAVYGLVLAAMALLAAAVGRGLPRRDWLVVGALVGVWLGVQFAISAATVSTAGTIWQGRYALPYAVGPLLVLAARRHLRGRAEPPTPAFAVIAGSVTLAHVISVVGVAAGEADASYLVAGFEWWPHSAPLVAGLALAGCACIVVACLRNRLWAPTGTPSGSDRPMVSI